MTVAILRMISPGHINVPTTGWLEGLLLRVKLLLCLSVFDKQTTPLETFEHDPRRCRKTKGSTDNINGEKTPD